MNTSQLSNEEIRSVNRILIIQYKPFGDVLLNTGYLPILRKKFSDAKIDYLIMRPYITILEHNPYIDELIIMEKKKNYSYFKERLRIIKMIRGRKYDLIIDQLRNTGSAEITLLSGAKYKLGWKIKRWNWIYNLKVPRTNLRYYSRLKFDLLQPLGIQEEPHNLEYRITKESYQYIDSWLCKENLNKQKLVVFSPGTPVLKKQWSLDYYAELGDLIQNNTEFKLILLWGPGEKEDVKYVQNKIKSKSIIAPATTFNQAAALLKRIKMYIGNDGGINHLAVATQTPSIAIFGPASNPKKWAAWHKDIHFYLRDRDFIKWNDHTFNITPEMVFKQFKEFFQL